MNGDNSQMRSKGPGLLRQVYYLLRLGRPMFLLGGFLLHGLGVVMALYNGAELELQVLIWTQVAITAIQLMTHYSNDYFDLAADEANKTPTRWSGGSRILSEGLLNPRIALETSITMALVALIAVLWLTLILEVSLLTMLLILISGLLGWSYSSPPLQLNMHGLGELTGAVLITGLTPIVGYSAQAGALTLLPFLAVIPLGCFQFAMLIVINVPDAASDIASGKHTLIYFLGAERTVRLYAVVLALAYLCIPLLLWLGLPTMVALALLLISPLAFWQGWRMLRGAWTKPDNWNSLGFWSVGLVMSSAGAEFFAFLYLLQ